ncbi:histidine kinase, partial [Pseudomonas syringae pv. pisi]
MVEIIPRPAQDGFAMPSIEQLFDGLHSLPSIPKV